MPFTPIDTLPEGEPDVRIYFTGLMILEPIENDACQVLVNSSATRHFLTIEVRRKTNNRPDEIMMRHVGPLAFFGPENDPQNPPVHGLRIEKAEAALTGVRRYTGGVGPKGEESFDLVVDFAGADLHNGDRPVAPDLVTGAARNLLDIDNLVGRPSIFLNDGILHTAAKTSDRLTMVLKQRNQPDRNLDPFAKTIGANIYLLEGEVVRLRWRNQGKLAELILEKPEPGAGVSYEIFVINDPLFESSVITNPVLDPKHDEFAEYYKLLTAVPTDEQFRLQVIQPPPGGPPPERGSTDIPCMSTTKGGGGH